MKLFVKKNHLAAKKYKAKASVFFKRCYDQKDTIVECLKALNQIMYVVKFIIEIFKIVH